MRDALFPEFRELMFGEFLMDSRNVRICVQGRSTDDRSREQNCVLETLESNRASKSSLVFPFIDEPWMGEPHFRRLDIIPGDPAEELEEQ